MPKYNKTYQCPYCKKRFTRDELSIHFERKHQDLLPEEFTPLRMAFHVVNNRPVDYRRPCRICGADTDWDENKGRYNFLCSKKSCRDTWIEKMKNDMGDKMGSNRPTATTVGLQKMLQSRKISGEYRWSDGSIKTYTGSYERKALSFCNKVLNIKSEDIICPGPILEYLLDGVKHIYIPDMYYIPYNLIIEVKDGGDNPNKNTKMSEVRKKSIAKEKYIIEKTSYNYIRLTDNDFAQLLSVFADLKMHLNDDDTSRVIHVNEDATTFSSMPTNGTMDGIIVVNYLQNNAFSHPTIGLADDLKLDNIVTVDGSNKLIKKSGKDILENASFTVAKVILNKNALYEQIDSNLGTIVTEDYLYELVFNHKRYTYDQFNFERR